jgi:MerR family transcriptional regulator, mercuric resistance operon regulatory protein
MQGEKMRGLDTKSRAAAITIGALSDSTGVNIETIRYYERIGLLPAPPRSAGRHRLYEDDHRQRLAFIRRARELGFSLDEVRALLGLTGRHGLACDEVKSMTEAHITDVRQKIRDLRRLERVLSDLAARCRPNKVPECPILEALSSRTP